MRIHRNSFHHLTQNKNRNRNSPIQNNLEVRVRCILKCRTLLTWHAKLSHGHSRHTYHYTMRMHIYACNSDIHHLLLLVAEAPCVHWIQCSVIYPIAHLTFFFVLPSFTVLHPLFTVNLVEELHHSLWFYILMGPKLFVVSNDGWKPSLLLTC